MAAPVANYDCAFDCFRDDIDEWRDCKAPFVKFWSHVGDAHHQLPSLWLIYERYFYKIRFEDPTQRGATPFEQRKLFQVRHFFFYKKKIFQAVDQSRNLAV